MRSLKATYSRPSDGRKVSKRKHPRSKRKRNNPKGRASRGHKERKVSPSSSNLRKRGKSQLRQPSRTLPDFWQQVKQPLPNAGDREISLRAIAGSCDVGPSRKYEWNALDNLIRQRRKPDFAIAKRAQHNNRRHLARIVQSRVVPARTIALWFSKQVFLADERATWMTKYGLSRVPGSASLWVSKGLAPVRVVMKFLAIPNRGHNSIGLIPPRWAGPHYLAYMGYR
jgi:hypothetical protein